MRKVLADTMICTNDDLVKLPSKAKWIHVQTNLTANVAHFDEEGSTTRATPLEFGT